jgi:hypothetical protein
MAKIPYPNSAHTPDYFKPYLEQVGTNDAYQMLTESLTNFPAWLRAIPTDKLDYRYAEGKWTLRELILHITDSERVFAYRALRFARHDKTPLSGFEQDDYVPVSQAADRSLESLLEEFVAVRKASIALFFSFSPETYELFGKANGYSISVAALAYATVGHEWHHRNVFEKKYLS